VAQKTKPVVELLTSSKGLNQFARFPTFYWDWSEDQ